MNLTDASLLINNFVDSHHSCYKGSQSTIGQGALPTSVVGKGAPEF